MLNSSNVYHVYHLSIATRDNTSLKAWKTFSPLPLEHLKATTKSSCDVKVGWKCQQILMRKLHPWKLPWHSKSPMFIFHCHLFSDREGGGKMGKRFIYEKNHMHLEALGKGFLNRIHTIPWNQSGILRKSRHPAGRTSRCLQPGSSGFSPTELRMRHLQQFCYTVHLWEVNVLPEPPKKMVKHGEHQHENC